MGATLVVVVGDVVVVVVSGAIEASTPTGLVETEVLNLARHYTQSKDWRRVVGEENVTSSDP